jgi:hypothetical protein
MNAISVGADNLVQWDRMTDPSTGSYVNNATVTFTLYTAAGGVISGVENVSMPYVAGSSGRYQGWIPYDTGLVSGQRYKLVITSTWSGKRGYRVGNFVAQSRGME